jgi:hypothetical protein
LPDAPPASPHFPKPENKTDHVDYTSFGKRIVPFADYWLYLQAK